MEVLKDLKKGLTIGFGFMLMLGIAGITYASVVSNGQTLTADLFNEKTVPSTAVMAFASDICPNGWSEYTQAYGRVIRGIDRSGTAIDPDGERTFGDTQEDQSNSIDQIHTYSNSIGSNGYLTIPDNGSWSAYSYGLTRYGYATDPRGIRMKKKGVETRSKNVALLYCIKN